MMTQTLAQGLKPVSVDFETLHARYNPLLVLVREMIGIVPNCDPFLEIWPPGFKAYNLLVPNMFNLPNTLFSKHSFKVSVGLAMYASSKAASAYCTAHTCSFALRRGARTEAIIGTRSPKEQAVVKLAEGLGRIPVELTLADVEAVREHFSSTETNWLVNAISMMGFLNKFMNAMGVELEQNAINDVGELLSNTGWHPGIHAGSDYRITNSAIPEKDNLFTYLRVIRQGPGALRLEKKWTRGVPADYPAASMYLREHTGYAFPILKPIGQKRVIRALTTVLCNNLDTELTITGLRVKMFAGYILAILVANDVLKKEVKQKFSALVPEVNEKTFETLEEIAWREIPADQMTCNETMISLQKQLTLTEKEAAVILLALAASYSPAKVNDAVIESTLRHLEPASVVEIVVWLSVLQLLHRLSSYYALVNAYEE
jgi:alkylhydroperoxidase family enzyme